MSKFKVKVKVTAACEYEVEVHTSTKAQSENTATGLWREKLPEDFQVEKGYITDWEIETEQLTAECPDCNTEHTMADSWSEDRDYCKSCGAKIETEGSVAT